MNIHKHFCWLLGHSKDMREWPWGVKASCTLMVPYCKHCDECLAALPFHMQMQEVWGKAYEGSALKFPSLYEELKKRA